LFYDRVNNRKFRANFLDILNTTLRVTKYEKNNENKHMCGMVTMPLDWIEKVETLDEITLHKMIIPSEICIEIDSFV
jgi:hypothetical protein